MRTACMAFFALLAASVFAQSNTTFYACVTKDGILTMVSADAACKGQSTKIQWNQAGPQGPQGQAGLDGITGYEVITGSDTLQYTFPAGHVQLECPNGKAVLGGGQEALSSVNVTLSGYPTGQIFLQPYPTAGSIHTIWNAHAMPIPGANPNTYVGTTMNAYAICGNVTP